MLTVITPPFSYTIWEKWQPRVGPACGEAAAYVLERRSHVEGQFGLDVARPNLPRGQYVHRSRGAHRRNKAIPKCKIRICQPVQRFLGFAWWCIGYRDHFGYDFHVLQPIERPAHGRGIFADAT